VPENLHPTIKWFPQYPNPLEANVQDIPWKFVNWKENLNFKLNSSTIKTSKLPKAACHFWIRLLHLSVLNARLMIKMNYMQLKN